MAKGQAGALVLIIILAILAVFLFPQFFGGGPSPTPVNFRNDIITIENLEISNLRPLEGGKLTINFDLVNNGDKEVENIEIDFGGTTKHENIEIGPSGCEEGTIDNDDKRCTFENIKSLDTRRVSAEYRAPNAGSANIEIKVNYPYRGSREILIPIIDDTTVRRPPRQFEQSTPTFGPFVIDVIPPTKGWAIGNQDFEVKFKPRFVGSVAAGKPTTDLANLNMEKGNFEAKLEGFQVVRCPQLTSEEGSDTITNAEREMVVNKEYSCNLQSKETDSQFGYKLGIVRIDFSYDYEYTKSQTIVVRPSP